MPPLTHSLHCSYTAGRWPWPRLPPSSSSGALWLQPPSSSPPSSPRLEEPPGNKLAGPPSELSLESPGEGGGFGEEMMPSSQRIFIQQSPAHGRRRLYLECVRLGKVGGHSVSDAHPHVKHLGGSVAEGQVADHHLLASFYVDDGESRPHRPGHLRDVQRSCLSLQSQQSSAKCTEKRLPHLTIPKED